MVQHAKPTDSGTYSCSPSLGDTVSVNVHVLRGNGTSVIWVPMRVWYEKNMSLIWLILRVC